MEHWIIRVKGRVQGVFYRKSTQEKAQELGLKGFVQNQADGSVHIQAQGSREKLEQLYQWCHNGPSAAKVTAVHRESEDLEDYPDFSIRST